MSLKRSLTEVIDEEEYNNTTPALKRTRKVCMTCSSQQITSTCEKPVMLSAQRTAILRCDSGVPLQESITRDTVICYSCNEAIPPNSNFYKCPKTNIDESNFNTDSQPDSQPDSLATSILISLPIFHPHSHPHSPSTCDQNKPCTHALAYNICERCFNDEKASYTGAITLGQRVRMRVNGQYVFGSIIHHWCDDDMYCIQIDGENRDSSQAYHIYDPFWDVHFIQSNTIRPSPIKMTVTREMTLGCPTVPRCTSGCKMIKMDAGNVYESTMMSISEEEDITTQQALKKKLSFEPPKLQLCEEQKKEKEKEKEEEAMEDKENFDKEKKHENKGVWCDSCKQFIVGGNSIYHCNNVESNLHPVKLFNYEWK